MSEITKDIDKLGLYRGDTCPITDSIYIKMPTLGEIVDYEKIYGVNSFSSMMFEFTSLPADFKWQLWDNGIDWTEVDEWDFFSTFLAPRLTNNRIKIVFGDVLDFSKMQKIYDDKIGDYKLVQTVTGKFQDEDFTKGMKSSNFLIDILKSVNNQKNEEEYEYTITFDRFTHNLLADVIREIFGFAKNKDNPANEVTKMAQIEDEKFDYELSKKEPKTSKLLNYISACVNSEGFKRDDKTVFDMNYYAFMDSVKRITHIQNSKLLLQSGYSGFGIDLKKVNKKELDWTS